MRFGRKYDCYLDIETDLEWSLENFGPMSWDEAMRQYPSNNEWRLPTVNELIALVDYELTNPATELPDMEPSGYWSSTTYAYGAWYVHFYGGYDDWYFKGSSYYVRAVRGGRKMNVERIKEIQKQTAYPESISVQQALLQVWREMLENTSSSKPGKWCAGC